MAEFVNPYASLLQELRARQAKLDAESTAPMFSPEQIQQRQAEIARNRAYGQIGLLSGDQGITNIARPMLAEAIKASEKRQTEHGEFDPVTGQFQYFPEYQRNRKQERLERQMQDAQKEAADAERRWNEGRQRSDEQRMLRQAIIASRPPADPGSLTYAGVHPETGLPILLHSKRGLTYQGQPYAGKVGEKREHASEGSLSYAGTDPTTGNPILLHSKKGFMNPATGTSHVGPVAEKPQGITAGERGNLASAVNNIQGLQETIKGLDRAKAAGAGTFTGIIPGFFAELHPGAQAIVTKMKTDEEKAAATMSAYISDGIRADRFGLTLTPHEKASSVRYLPSEYDSIDELRRKNEALLELLTKGYNNSVTSMTRPGLPPPGIPGGPTSAPPMQPGAGRVPAPVTITPPAQGAIDLGGGFSIRPRQPQR